MNAAVTWLSRASYFGWILLTLLTGCFRPADSTSIKGTYLADYDVATERLVLDADGKFNQYVTIKNGGKVSSTSGTWTYDGDTGYIMFDGPFMIVVDGLRHFDPNYGQPKFRHATDSVQNVFGRITIGSNDRVLYRKIPN